jgi:hypothetical protein
VLFRKVRALQYPELGRPIFHTPARCCSFTAIGASHTLAAGCNDLFGQERRAVSRRDSLVLLRSDGLALWLSCWPASSGISVFASDHLATFRETIQRPMQGRLSNATLPDSLDSSVLDRLWCTRSIHRQISNSISSTIKQLRAKGRADPPLHVTFLSVKRGLQ